jgi:hypothetical protein
METRQEPSNRGVLTLSARRILDRVEIELAHDGGMDDGRLTATSHELKPWYEAPRIARPAGNLIQAPTP